MKIVIPAFSGIAPRLADRLLDPTQASFVANLKPTNGNLRGFRSLELLERLPLGGVYKRAIRLYYTGTDNFEWFLSEDVNADALKSPLATDAFERVYFTDANFPKPQITTLPDMGAGNPSSDLGIPRPVTAPTVNITGGSGTSFVAAYTYIYVDEYGALSAPSPPTIGTGFVNSTKQISFPGPHPSSAVFIDVYRSLAGEETSGSYYKVGRHTGTGGVFTDTIDNDDLALQPILDTFDNDPPLDGLKGLTQHSSGALVGFVGRTVAFSLPYLPHAWPESFRYVMPDEVVAIAAISNAVIVMTKSSPLVLSGTRPDAIAFVILPDIEPCISKRSAVVMNGVVMYASPNGIVSISTSGLSRPTNKLMTRDEFALYSSPNMIAAVYGSYYICFYEDNRGFAVALPPYEPVSFVPLDRYAAVTGLDTDDRSGDLYVLQTNLISVFDRVKDKRFATTFRSKEFIVPKPVNFGAFQVIHQRESTVEDDDDTEIILQAAREYNEDRYAAGPLDLIGDYPIGGGYTFSPPLAVDEILGGLPPLQPLGGEPLYETENLFILDGVNFSFFADGKLVYTTTVFDEREHRLPAGYKATRYYIEIASSLSVETVAVAETAAELREA